jgi:hypothetical protein
MNKKGQSIITIFFWVVVFFIVFAMFFGKWINDVGKSAVVNNSLTGFEAFVLSNLNVVIIIGVLIFILVYVYVGGRQ